MNNKKNQASLLTNISTNAKEIKNNLQAIHQSDVLNKTLNKTNLNNTKLTTELLKTNNLLQQNIESKAIEIINDTSNYLNKGLSNNKVSSVTTILNSLFGQNIVNLNKVVTPHTYNQLKQLKNLKHNTKSVFGGSTKNLYAQLQDLFDETTTLIHSNRNVNTNLLEKVKVYEQLARESNDEYYLSTVADIVNKILRYMKRKGANYTNIYREINQIYRGIEPNGVVNSERY